MKNIEHKRKQVSDVLSTIIGKMRVLDLEFIALKNKSQFDAGINGGLAEQVQAQKDFDLAVGTVISEISDHDLKQIIDVLERSTIAIRAVDKIE